MSSPVEMESEPRVETLPRISEADRRRPEFIWGYLAYLGDGQIWWFCVPQIRHDVDHGYRGWTFGAGVDDEINRSLSEGLARCLRKIGRAIESHCSDLIACAYLELAWLLLARNYDITQEEFESIILEDCDIEGNADTVAKIFRIMNDIIISAVMGVPLQEQGA